MSIATRFFSGVPSGTELINIIGGIQNAHTGYVDQIVITQVSGTATTMQIQVRYDSGIQDRQNLVYLYDAAPSANFVDSNINAPFDLTNPESSPDLVFLILTDSPGVFNVRIDLNILPRQS